MIIKKYKKRAEENVTFWSPPQFVLLNNCHKKFGKEKEGNRLKRIYRKNRQNYKKNLQRKHSKL